MRTSSLNWRHFDFLLLGAVAVLVIIGITMIRSAVAGNIELAELDLVQRQLIFAVVGFVVIILTASIDYHLWSSISRTLYVGMFGLLAVLSIVGAAVFGSARWFDTGLVLIQPSELAKIVMILVLADYFARNNEKLHDMRWVLRSFLLTMGVVGWILLQPNLSTSIVIIVIWFALLWAAGLHLKHLIAFTAAGIVLPIAAWPFLVDYQQARIMNFLFPDLTARHGEIYNIQQALISIGSGGWFGQGYGSGSQVQLRFLKVRWSDFIFSAMAEEFGFIGILVIMFLLLFVIYRCLRAARLARDTFGALIAYGVATLIAFQAVVNIGVNLNLMPATGLTLPFVSYGGSSLLSALLGIGLVESVILRYKALEFSAGDQGT
ncbi:MAG: rod shape-determining protein RodA [Anaerolineales bacterium]|nr:rod shape-determining protein RodA [Anaerolineales bacterium]MCK5314257.1 rod shape-determining protein RodA [Anaerolineales bacterium]